MEAQANTELAERIRNLEQEVARHREDSGKAQAEVDRLLEILREMENEKNDKDKKISELERWVCGSCQCACVHVVDIQGWMHHINVYKKYLMRYNVGPQFVSGTSDLCSSHAM